MLQCPEIATASQLASDLSQGIKAVGVSQGVAVGLLAAEGTTMAMVVSEVAEEEEEDSGAMTRTSRRKAEAATGEPCFPCSFLPLGLF